MENSIEERMLRAVLRMIDAHYARLRERPKDNAADKIEQVYLPMLERIEKIQRELRSDSRLNGRRPPVP